MKGCIGFIDGTHIRLASSLCGERDYYNHKGFPSIQLQVVDDDRLCITSAFVDYPGCTHDARVFRNSALCQRMDSGQLPLIQDGLIIGDSAYPLKSWLVTPFRDRQCVERSIGMLKGRFRRLREVSMHDPADICTLIISACILHNVCIKAGDVADDISQSDDDEGHPNTTTALHPRNVSGIQRMLDIMNAL